MADAPRPPSVPAEPSLESADLVKDPWSPRPDEQLRFYFFEGLLEANAGVRADIEAALDKVEEVELGEARLDVDGRRARLMLEEGAAAGQKLDDRSRARLLHALQEFLESGGEARGAESTLRCTEVFETRVRETLFRPVGAKLETVCRLRGKTPRDDARAPKGLGAPRGLAGFEWRTVVVLVTLLFVGFGLSAWSSGWVDRVLAAPAGELAVERGAFEGLLELQMRQRWGKYEIEIRRGPDFPSDARAIEAALAASSTTSGRAAVNAVSNGEDVYVLIESSTGRTLASARVSLRPLLADEHAVVETEIWGRMLAHRVRISLDDGKKGTGEK